jgi:hypothetical protein
MSAFVLANAPAATPCFAKAASFRRLLIRPV